MLVGFLKLKKITIWRTTGPTKVPGRYLLLRYTVRLGSVLARATKSWFTFCNNDDMFSHYHIRSFCISSYSRNSPKMKCVAVILISLALAAVLTNAMPDNDNTLPEDHCHGDLRSAVGGLCAEKNQVSISLNIV